MSGKEDYIIPTKEKMDRAVELLDKYESGLNLPKHEAPGTEEELNEYFTWDRDVIEAMPPDKCASAAYRLAQFSFFIQREVNRETAREKWAKAQLDDAVAPHLNSYDKYMKHEVKMSLICKENSYAQVLNSILRKAEQRITRLTYLSNSINNLSSIMLSIHKTKVYNKHE